MISFVGFKNRQTELAFLKKKRRGLSAEYEVYLLLEKQNTQSHIVTHTAAEKVISIEAKVLDDINGAPE